MAVAALRTTTYVFGRHTIDIEDERLHGPNGPIRIGNKAFRVLAMLIQHQGRLVTKDMLMSSVWDGTIVSEFALTSVIKELRRALGDDARTPRFIESVYGRGYRLLCEAICSCEHIIEPTLRIVSRDEELADFERADETIVTRKPREAVTETRAAADRSARHALSHGLLGALLATSVLVVIPTEPGGRLVAAEPVPTFCANLAGR